MKNLLPFFFLVFICVILGCQNESPPFLSEHQLPLQSFSLDPTIENQIKGKNGTQITIPANTFTQSSPNGKVNFQLREALSLSDMLLANLHTIASDGSILESYGMIQMNVAPQQNPQYKINVAIPTSFSNPQAQLFHLSANNEWEVESKITATNATDLAKGKQLFVRECRMCHDQNLRNDLTGPALGNIHLFREEEWLINFTKQSQQMIANSDSLAICHWEQWKPTIMSDFTHLADDSIKMIYKWIANESQMQRIDTNEVEFVLECHFDTIDDADDPNNGFLVNRYFKSNTKVTETNVYYNNNLYSIDTTRFGQFNGILLDSIIFIPDAFYEFSTNRLGWKNIDYFLKQHPLVKTPTVQLLNFSSTILPHVKLVFKSRNVVLDLYPPNSTKNLYTTIFPNSNGKVRLPKEEVVLLVYSQSEDHFLVGKKTVQIGEQNDFELELKPSTQDAFKQFIDSL